MQNGPPLSNVASMRQTDPLKDLGLDLGSEQKAKLLDFSKVLLHWNKRTNLISRGDESRVQPRHILDSLAAATFLVGDKVVDIGSGAGLPGLPLAIACPQKKFTLCDRMKKRTHFMRFVIANLGIDNAQVIEAPFEEIASRGESYDCAVSRGVGKAEALWPVIESAIAETGRLIVYASTQSFGEELIGESVGKTHQGGTRISSAAVEIPGLNKSHWFHIIDKEG
jgi:16S rRNA (guanine527-N7)-methyltransferase